LAIFGAELEGVANAVLTAHRKRFPDDQRSDSEIMQAIAASYPEFTDRFSDFANDLMRLTRANAPQPSGVPSEIQSPDELSRRAFPPTAGDYAKQVAGSFIRGAASTIGAIPEAIGSAARIAGTYSAGAEHVPMYVETPPGELETAVTRAGEAVSPEPVPGLEKSFLATTVPAGIGSGAGFIVAGGVAGLAERSFIAGIARRSLTSALERGLPQAEAESIGTASATIAARRLAYGNIAALGALSQAQQGYEEAKKAGADEHARLLAFSLNLPLGMTEAVPLANMLNKMDKLSGGTLKHGLLDIATDSFEEALQNSLQGLGGDVIASKIARYEPDRKLFSSFAEDAASGGIAAAVLSMATAAIGGKLRLRPGQEGAKSEPPPPAAGANVPQGTSTITPPAAAPPAAPDVAAQYASEEQKRTARLVQIQDAARRSVVGGYGADEIHTTSTLTPDEQIIFQQTVDRTRAEKAAADQETAARSAAAAPAAAPPVVAGDVPAPETTAAVPPAAVPAVTTAATVPIPASEASELPSDLEAVAQVVAAPTGRLTKEQMDLIQPLAKDNPALYAAFMKRVGYLRGQTVPPPSVPENPSTVPVPPAAQPTPPVPTPTPVPAPVQAARAAAATALGTPRAAPSISNVYVPPGLLAKARAQALALARAGGRVVRRAAAAVTKEHPMVDSIDFDGDSPLTFELSGRGVGERTATPMATVDADVVLITKGEWEGETGKLIGENPDGTAKISLPNATVLAVDPRDYETIRQVRKNIADEEASRRRGVSQEPGSVGLSAIGTSDTSALGVEKTTLAPAFFEITKPIEAKEDAVQNSGIVSRRSPTGEVPHGSRFLWTHRWTVFKRGNRITVMPTYKSEAGAIMAAQPGKKQGTSVVELIKAGFKPVASFRSDTAQHAIEAAKPVLTQEEYDRTLAGPARARMAALARTAAAVEAQRVPTPAATGDEMRIRGLPRDLPGQTEDTGQEEPSTKPVTRTVKFSGQLSNDLFPVLTRALAMEAPDPKTGEVKLSLSTNATIAALTRYVQKGKFREEVLDLTRELSESIGEHNAVDIVFGRIVEAYNNNRSSADFAKALSRDSGIARALRSEQGLPVAAGQGGTGARQVAAAAAPSENRGVPGAAKGIQRSQPKFSIAGGGYYAIEHVTAKLQRLLDVLSLAGVDVTVLEGQLGTVGGAQLDNSIVLVMSDVANPSAGELVAAVHEASHLVAGRESQEMQERLHRAVEQLGDRIALPPGVAARLADPKVDAETRVAERLAYGLERQGVDAISARGLGQRIIRALKDLWYRATMAIQAGIFGQESINPERVLAYFTNRLNSFLAGDIHPTSFVNFLGGGKPSLQRQVRYYVPTTQGGSGWDRVTFDWENGKMTHGVYLPTNTDAAAFNIINALREGEWKYRHTTYVDEGEQIGGENPTVRAGWAYAAAAKVGQVDQAMYSAFNASGRNTSTSGGPLLTLNDFVDIFKGDDVSRPAEIQARANEELAALGAPPVNPDLSIDGPVTFHNDATKQQARAIALGSLQNRLANFCKRFVEETSRRASLLLKAQTKIAKQDRLAQRYQDLTETIDGFKEWTRGAIEWTKNDIRSFVRDAKTIGEITQAIREFQADVTAPIPATYEALIDRMADRLFSDAPHFTDFLQEASTLAVDWHGQTLPQIKNQLRGLLAANPLFSGLAEDEQNVALSLVGAFARANDHHMAWLAVRASNAHEARDAIRNALTEARKGTTEALNRARDMVDRIPRMAAYGQRILSAYVRSMEEVQAVVAEQFRNGMILNAYDASHAILRQEIQNLERPLAARKLLVPSIVEGAELPFVASDTDTVAQIEAAKPFVLTLTGDGKRTPTEVQALRKRYDTWVATNHLTGGAMVETLRDLSRQLGMIDATKQQVAIKQSWLSRMVGTIADSMRQTGTLAGARVGEMMTRYSRFTGAHERGPHGLETFGFRVEAAKDKAMKALRIRDAATFNELFHQQAKGYLEKRKDLQERPDAHEAALGALHQFFLSNPAIRDLVTPAAWDRLRAYYEANVDYNRAMVRINKAIGNRIEDQNLGLYRDAIGDPLFTFPRGLSASIERLFHKMRGEWNGTKTGLLKAGDVAAKFTSDPTALAAELNDRFTGDVWRQFVGEMASRPGRAMFSGRMYGPGRWTIATVEHVALAFRDASSAPTPGARALAFATRLHALEGGTPDTLAAHVGETLETLQNYFNALEKIFGSTEELKDRFGINVGVPRFLMDARVSEDFPTGWLEYQHFDQNHARSAVHRMAFHGAYGRDGAAVATEFNAARSELKTAIGDWTEYLRRVGIEKPLATGKEKIRLAKELAAKEGRSAKDISMMEKAKLNLDVVNSTEGHFEAWSKTYSGDLVEAKAMLEGLSLITGLLVQGPKTAMINTMDLLGGPFLQYGLSKQAISMARGNWAAFANSAAGSLLNTIGVDFHRNSTDMLLLNRLGYGDQDNSIARRDHLMAAANAEIPGGPIISRAIRGGRFVRALTQVGIPQAGGVYTTLKAAPFSVISRWMNEGFIISHWKAYRGLVGRAVEFYRANPTMIDDPDFRFSAADLGYQKGPLLDDERAFTAVREAMGRWGMSIEGMAQDALKSGAPLISDHHYQALAEMALEEMSLEASPTTAPRWGGNPVGRFAMPLLRWSFARTNQLRKSFNEPNGEASVRAFMNGLKAFSIITGVGIAYALLMERYDEDLTGKKSNIRGFGQDNNFLAALEMTARMGGWGLWGDLANTVGNFGGSGDLRGMSLDNRVVFVNSLMNLAGAVTTLAKQGDATYATVYRQVLQAIGGSGYLQVAQIVNNAFSLDNAESRVTSRINVNNWLRAVGREMNLDVRVGRAAGAYALPTEATPWISEMLLAAMANDQGDFLRAYSKAIAAARNEGKPDPADYVKRSYESRNPLRTVFTTPPSSAEYGQILMRLPDSGRQAVQSAMLLLAKYGSQIGAKDYFGKVEKIKPAPLEAPAPRPTAMARAYAARSLAY
jgi:hypothetical protein